MSLRASCCRPDSLFTAVATARAGMRGCEVYTSKKVRASHAVASPRSRGMTGISAWHLPPPRCNSTIPAARQP